MIESIVLMTDERTRKSFEAMSAEDAGNILKGLLRHAAGEEIDDSDWSPLALAVYPLIEGQVDRMSELREKRAAAGRASAESRAEATCNKLATNLQQVATTHQQDSTPVPVPIPEPEQKKESPTETRKKFQAPTVQEVKAYADEKGLNVDAQRFVDYYSSKGWLVGKSPMKDWRAACRNWSASGYRGTDPPKKQQTDYKSKLMSMDYGDLLRRQT